MAGRDGEGGNDRMDMAFKNKAKERRYKAMWASQWRKLNPARNAAARAKFNESHPYYSTEYYRNNKSRLLQQVRKPHRRKTIRMRTLKMVECLSDEYIRRRLSQKTKVPMRLWPIAFVELKRAELKLKRLLEVRARLSAGSIVKGKQWPNEVVELKRVQLKLKRLWQNQKTSQSSGTSSSTHSTP